MKQHTKLLLPCLFLSTGLHALVNLGEGYVDLVVTASATYDTEIRARNSGQEDFVFRLSPSLEYRRSSRNLDFSASVGVTAIQYVDYDQYSDENFFFDLNISPSTTMETSRFVFSGDLLFNNETRSEETIGQIVTVRNYGASAQLIYDPNRNYNVVSSVSFRRQDPESNALYDVDRLGGLVKLQVPVRENLYVEGGVGYEDTDSERDASDSQVYTYFVGLDGSITSRLSGSVQGGIQQRDLDEGGKETSPYFSAGLSWKVDESTTVDLTGSKSFGTTLDGRTSETMAATLTAKRQMSRDLSSNVFIGYDEDDLEGLTAGMDRKDEEVYGGVGLNYSLARWGSIGGSVRYSDQKSTSQEFEFDRWQIGVNFTGTW